MLLSHKVSDGGSVFVLVLVPLSNCVVEATSEKWRLVSSLPFPPTSLAFTGMGPSTHGATILCPVMIYSIVGSELTAASVCSIDNGWIQSFIQGHENCRGDLLLEPKRFIHFTNSDIVYQLLGRWCDTIEDSVEEINSWWKCFTTSQK